MQFRRLTLKQLAITSVLGLANSFLLYSTSVEAREDVSFNKVDATADTSTSLNISDVGVISDETRMLDISDPDMSLEMLDISDGSIRTESVDEMNAEVPSIMGMDPTEAEVEAEVLDMSSDSTMSPNMPDMSSGSDMSTDVPDMNDDSMSTTIPSMNGNSVMNSSSRVINNNQEDWPSPVDDNQIYRFLRIDQLEYRMNSGGEDTLNTEFTGWIGGDYQRLWIKSEGDIGLTTGDGEAELQLLYGKLISPFFDFQAGIRYDQTYSSQGGPGRAFGVVGIQGLAPYLFDVDAALFVSQEADISARASAEYQLYLTQRLVLQPNATVNVALQKVEAFDVGSGLNDLDLGLRLRYEVSREFAPYAGVSWTRSFGETADLVRQSGGSVEDFAIVGGVQLLF